MQKLKQTFSSWSAFDRAIQVKQSDYTSEEDKAHAHLGFQWSNQHLDPVSTLSFSELVSDENVHRLRLLNELGPGITS